MSDDEATPEGAARPPKSMPESGIIAMPNWRMLDKMMATMKKLADAKAAGRTRAAARAERKLARLMKRDPVTAGRLAEIIDESGGGGT